MPLPVIDNRHCLCSNSKVHPAKYEEVTAYLGLGSNLGDREGTLRRAIELIGTAPSVRVDSVSSFYETEPVGFVEQGRFINAAACVKTTLSAHELLRVCQGVEYALGRVRTIKWGPRTLDIDILLYGDDVLDTEDLKVPHPLMHERRFVLEPLSEIAPDAFHPVLRMTVRELLDRCAA